MEILSTNLDFIFFVCGLFFLLLGATCSTGAPRSKDEPAWLWLASFGFLHGLTCWTDMLAQSLGDTSVFRTIRLLLMAGSYLALIEFGRRGWVHDRARLSCWWIYTPLLAFAGAGCTMGMDGLTATCRYVLGLTGGVFAAMTLWSAARHGEIMGRFALRLSALAFSIYALTAGLIVPTAMLFPVLWLNLDGFWGTAGFSIQLVLTLCASVTSIGVWVFRHQTELRKGRSNLLDRWLIPVMLGALLVATWFTVEWRGQLADAEMRERLLDQAASIAQTISPEEVKALWFTPEDKTNPAYQRIRGQMIAYGHLIKQRSIYSLAIRNGVFVFGPENISENDPWASPPGTIYEQPKPEDWDAFRLRKPYTSGPATDEYGTFVSALSPVLDPRSGEVIMLVGLDIAVGQWLSDIAFQRLVPILFAIALSTILMVSAIAVSWRERISPKHRPWLRYSEVVTTASIGLVLSLVVALLAHEDETRSRRLMFTHLANAKVELINTRMHSLGEDLANIARFYLATDNVTRQEFHVFVAPMTNNAIVQAYEWVPRVTPDEKKKVEESARRDGFEDFDIFESKERGEKSPAVGREVYYPVYYVEPLTGNESVLGFDLGSEAHRRAAIEEAERTELPMASESVPLLQEDGRNNGILVYHPTYDESTSGQDAQKTTVENKSLSGFAVAVLRTGALLQKTLFPGEQDGQVASIELMQLGPGGEKKMLAAFPEEHFHADAAEALSMHLRESDLCTVRPLFAFGRTYAVVINPGLRILSSHPVHLGWTTGLIGLFLTAVLTMFVGFLRNRQTYLEKQVRARTAELQEREQALEASEASLQGILQSISEGILAVNKDNRVLFANERFVEMWKIPQELVDSADDSAIIHYVLDQLTDPQSFFERVRRLYDSKEEAFDTLYLKDGNVYERRSRPMIQGEEMLGRVWSFLDVTERKHAEEEKEKLEARLRQTHKIEALGTLAGGIAHDFNNILAAIIGYTEMALTDISPSNPKRQYLGQVLNAGHRAKDLVKQILASSRQTLAQERIPVEITPVIEEALKLLRASLPSTIEIRQRIGSETGLILADPTEVHQVLVNLCTNAAHAMEEKGGVLDVSLGEVTVDTDVVGGSADLKPGEYLRLTVSDTGHGIDPATLERIFDPYFTTKEVGRGSGLGLAVVNGIVKRHEGTVAVSSEPGVGTTFHVYFPRTESTDLWEIGEKEEPLPRGTERVLFVDDEQPLVEMGKSILEWLGYQATVTTSSEEALELFRADPGRFDAVITDYTMPQMTGVDLAKEMMRTRPDIPVILCTGFSEKISEEKAREMGIRAYAMKPLNMRDIAETVRRVLDQNGRM